MTGRKKVVKNYFEIKKRYLALIAGAVWMIAGFNVVRLGVISYKEITPVWYLYVLSVVIFVLFGMMFFKMSRKHLKRIKGYGEEKRPFWNFFDLKSYIIMAIMMGGGIGFRAMGVFPDAFIAFFYTGLGCALFMAGILFVIGFITFERRINNGI